MSMAERERLPNRRESEVVEFDHDGIRYRAAISMFADGRVGEIFLDGAKIGSAAQVAGHEAAIACSLAMQHGCSFETLRHALQKLDNGRSAGPLGVALDVVSAEKPDAR